MDPFLLLLLAVAVPGLAVGVVAARRSHSQPLAATIAQAGGGGAVIGAVSGLAISAAPHMTLATAMPLAIVVSAVAAMITGTLCRGFFAREARRNRPPLPPMRMR